MINIIKLMLVNLALICSCFPSMNQFIHRAFFLLLFHLRLSLPVIFKVKKTITMLIPPTVDFFLEIGILLFSLKISILPLIAMFVSEKYYNVLYTYLTNFLAFLYFTRIFT